MRRRLPFFTRRTMAGALAGLTVALVGIALTSVSVTPAQASTGVAPNIAGGTTAAPGEFPWLVRLTPVGCGGALYTPTLVLTAAHCVSRTGADTSITITQGAVDLQDPNRTTRKSVFTHRATGYVESAVAPSIDGPLPSGDDWALVQLDSPIYGVPLLKIATDTSLQNGSLTVVGWGSTTLNGDQQRYLRKGTVDFVSDSVCQSIAKLQTLDVSDAICAGNVTNYGMDACPGDSGGPLLKRNPAGEWIELGVVSFGFGCATQGLPTVYTEANAFAADICTAAVALGGCPNLASNLVSDRSGVVGTAFAAQLSASGGQAPYTWSVTGLPFGVPYNGSTGLISGTPTTAGTFQVVYTVTDGMAQSVTNAFTWTIALTVPSVTGNTQAQAIATLNALGLAHTTYTVTVWDSSDKGRVMNQIPAVGTAVAPGSNVQLAIGLWGGSNR